MDLFVNLGFEKNPFSKFSAEEEQIYLKEIYEAPRYYQTLLEEIAGIYWEKEAQENQL